MATEETAACVGCVQMPIDERVDTTGDRSAHKGIGMGLQCHSLGGVIISLLRLIMHCLRLNCVHPSKHGYMIV